MTNENKRRGMLWSYAPVLIWLGVIFFLSSSEGSASNTSRIIGPLLHFFFPDISPERQAFVHFLVRKAAHFTEYGILVFLSARALIRFGFDRTQWVTWLLPLLLVAVIAGIDELNQSRETTRTGSVADVLLDLSGGVFASVGGFLVSRAMARRKGSDLA